MVNRAKQKGTAFESSLLPLLQEYYPGTERRALHGALDRGDFNMPGAPITLEAKNHKTMSLGVWVDEATAEAINAGVEPGVVVHKRRGTTDPRKQFVTMELGALLELLRRITSP